MEIYYFFYYFREKEILLFVVWKIRVVDLLVVGIEEVIFEFLKF